MGNFKPYEQLTFTDDYLFCKILTGDLELCRKLLEVILQKPIREVRLSESQKTIRPGYDAKYVRFDVYVEDDADSVYDLEMQTTTPRNLPKRSRYYQGMMDLEHMEQKMDYEALSKSYVIFICLTDPFPPNNKAVYRFRELCVDNPEIEMQDGTEKIFLNASGDRTGLPDEMRDFLDYLVTNKPSTALTEGLDAAVQTARLNEDWRHVYMTLQMKLDDAKAEGIAEGKAEGIEEGKQKEREESARRMIHAGKLSDEEISDYTGLTVPQIQNLREKMHTT